MYSLFKFYISWKNSSFYSIYNMLYTILKIYLISLCVLLSVAFYTLLERKVLSYIQIRKGPNKVGLVGIFQPISDAIKLFVKEMVFIQSSNKLMFCVVSVMALFVSLTLWGLYPSSFSLNYIMYSLFFFMCASGLNVYIITLAGWSSNSAYSFLGSLRASAQSISYEISMMTLILFPMFILMSMSFQSSVFNFPVSMLLLPMLFLWFVTLLAETNRAPFDFAEGESEIVSGFNIEYAGGLFALLFLGEYTSILFMSMMTSVWFLYNMNMFFFMMNIIVMSLFFLIIRGVYPRFRYDLLMYLCWKSLLPFSICVLLLVPMTFLV
uniref:NADH-ubiquinone oxidoreductase chain 1 n=1 Tax=Partulina redfieldi TaxID=115954 RepID=A0A3Q9U0V5_9EUPU|nr:NADH dehydrogenase subunit 1 [Partulina redfieldi]AZZ06743.1 NADH dehydrogenase subunit 1 [Partulina redfieldi]